ncbi:MAG TPA: hypothetical protein VEL75_19725 [Candidatus Methylomirabilis sp.]|nr:hypothetical protein [Candidatus Methylomirabilis sp.]
MTGSVIAAALLGASAEAFACPICLGAGQPSKAQELVTAPGVVLAMPTRDASHFRITEVIKGERPPSGTIEGGYPRSGPIPGAEAPTRGRPLLLVSDEQLPTWIVLGAIDAGHSGWLRKIAAGKRAAEMSAEEWRARVALVVPYLESPDPLAAEIAVAELNAAPYAALRAAKSRLSVSALRRWLADPDLVARQSPYLLLLGFVGNARDAAALEQRLDAASQSGDPTNLAPMLAADLELRGDARMRWIDEKYLRDPKRSTHEIEAVVLALGAHGQADGTITRERVIQSYRMFIKERKDLAGLVAPDLAAWNYWDAVPEYAALMKSDVRQEGESRFAIAVYLRQSQGAGETPRPAVPAAGSFDSPLARPDTRLVVPR